MRKTKQKVFKHVRFNHEIVLKIIKDNLTMYKLFKYVVAYRNSQLKQAKNLCIATQDDLSQGVYKSILDKE